MSQGSPAATGSGTGTAEPAHGQHGDSSSDAAAASAYPSAVAADASSTSPPPLPPAAPLERPQEERGREQAGGSCSAAAAGVDREGEGIDPAAPSSAPSPPSSDSSSPDGADAAAAGAGPFNCSVVFQQMLQEQTAIKEAGGPLAEGAGKRKRPEKAQVKSSHAIGELWNNLRKFFHGESPGYVHYSQHVNHQTHPMTEVRKYYLVSDLATGQGVDHLDAYSKFRRVTGDGECFYRSFIFSYLEQVLDRHDTHEEHRLLDALKRVSVQHADLRWTSEFPRSYRAFKKLIKKVKRWKRHGRWKWNSIASTSSYRKEKLLEFFRSYDTTEDN
uniref:Ubiquitinyl hydrolase 1 n=1 Tax=Triticum urartu TaxID=4572 RepID=A0A8R7PYA7_TRIUA